MLGRNASRVAMAPKQSFEDAGRKSSSRFSEPGIDAANRFASSDFRLVKKKDPSLYAMGLLL